MRKEEQQKHRSASLAFLPRRSGFSSQHASAAKESLDTAELFRDLLEPLDVGVALASPEGAIDYANSRFAELLGQEPDERLIGCNLKKFVNATCWRDLLKALGDGSKALCRGEMGVEGRLGDSRQVSLSIAPFDSAFLGRRAGPLVQIIASEVTELVKTQQALRIAEESLRSLASQFMKLQDDERRRMARDLHDVTGQELAVALMALDRAGKIAGHLDAKCKEAINEANVLVRKVETEIRTLSYVLHPPLLDEMGLVSALKAYVDGLVQRTGVRIELVVPAETPRFALEKETALFRVAQEGLTNVLRHSGSSRAYVVVSMSHGAVSVSVRDDGKGFDPDKVKSSGRTGVGIAGMRGRLDQVGGEFEVQSGPEGTLLTATVPIADVEESVEIASPSQSRRPSSISRTSNISQGARKRILIADDHEVARRGIRDLFRDLPDLEICGEASDGMEAVAKARELNPDLLILDLTMPRLSGFAVLNRVRAINPEMQILMYTTHSHPDLERTARAGGCAGYVQKANAARDLIRGVRAALEGKTFFSSDAERAAEA